jgi:polar amino acid transport system substrate-binding protein
MLALITALWFGPALANDSDLWRKSTLNQIIKRGELRVGMELGYAPFEMKSKSGKIIGFDVDIAQSMADAMGVKLRLVAIDWNGMTPALLTEQFDIIMSGMTITPERNLWINFAQPYMTVGQTVLLKRALRHKVKKLKHLNKAKYVVVTKSGTTAHAAAKQHLGKAELRLFDSEQAALQHVLDGKADAFVYDLPYNVVQFALNKKKLAFLSTPFTQERLGWGVRKGDPDFLNWLNHFLAQIQADGTYEEIRKRWFKDRAWMEQVY